MITQEQYVTAAQLAGLPGMPARSGHVPRAMKRLGIEGREKAGQGGGREWPLASLPAATRAALAQRSSPLTPHPSPLSTAPAPLPADSRTSSPVPAQPAEKSSPTAAFSSLIPHPSSLIPAAAAGAHEARKAELADTINSEGARSRRLSGLRASLHQPVNGQRRMDARIAVVTAFERFHQAADLAVRVSRPRFAHLYNTGEITVEPWVRDVIPDLSDASIWRWQAAIQKHGIARLAGNYGKKKGATMIERQPELNEFLVSMLVTYPHTTVANIQKGMRARFNGHNSIDYPSPRALQRWVTNWKRDNAQTYTALTNPDQWKGRYMVAFGSQSDGVERVNQRWELDSTPGDVMLTDGRYAVIGVVDVHSRRGRLLVAKTSKAAAIATLLRHALLDWGAPEQAKTDNGSDYTSNHITRVFRSLDVEHALCPPFQPWHKPHIERFFGTFSHGLVELLPNFIGHSVAERQAIEARRSFADRLMKRGATLEVSMTAAEFQSFCDRWCEDIYLHQPHQGLKGRTPFEVVAAARDTIRTITDPRALDLLLAEAADGRTRVVQKKGIKIDDAWFIAPELGEYVGETVLPLLDPLDLGRVYVYDMAEGYLCTAECPERTGMDRQVVAAKAREIQKGQVQEERAALRATAKKVRTDDIVREIIEKKAEAAGVLARLPGPAAAHASAGLAEATRAVRGRRVPEQPAVSADEMAAVEASIAAPAASSHKVVALDNPEANYRRWLKVETSIAAGAAVSDKDRAWHASYRGCAEWHAMKQFAEDFPESSERSA